MIDDNRKRILTLEQWERNLISELEGIRERISRLEKAMFR